MPRKTRTQAQVVVDKVAPETGVPSQTSSSEPVGYLMHRPSAKDKGNKLIFITRPQGNPFGGNPGGGTAIFAIDEVVPRLKDGCIVARSAQGEIQFSADMPYLVIPRSLGSPVTTADMAKAQLQEKREWDAVMEEEDRLDAVKQQAVTTTEDGRQRNNPGQYL